MLQSELSKQKTGDYLGETCNRAEVGTSRIDSEMSLENLLVSYVARLAGQGRIGMKLQNDVRDSSSGAQGDSSRSGLCDQSLHPDHARVNIH
jgi:hypothetical protein